eukprot:3235985-Rhodomonas_salina.1
MHDCFRRSKGRIEPLNRDSLHQTTRQHLRVRSSRSEASRRSESLAHVRAAQARHQQTQTWNVAWRGLRVKSSDSGGGRRCLHPGNDCDSDWDPE